MLEIILSPEAREKLKALYANEGERKHSGFRIYEVKIGSG